MGSYLLYAQPTHRVSRKSAKNFLCNPVYRQTNWEAELIYPPPPLPRGNYCKHLAFFSNAAVPHIHSLKEFLQLVICLLIPAPLITSCYRKDCHYYTHSDFSTWGLFCFLVRWALRHITLNSYLALLLFHVLENIFTQQCSQRQT